MESEYIKHWIELMKPIFPSKVHFEEKKQDLDIHIEIFWKLENDPNRPTKNSRRIDLIIPFEYTEDYQKENNKNQNNVDQRLINFIKEQFKKFNQNHNLSKHESPPIEEWIVPKYVFYS